MAGKTDGFLADCCFKHPPCWWTFSECAMFIHVCQLDPKFPLLNPDCSRLNPNICCLILNVSLLDFPRSGSNPQKIPEVCPLKKHEKTWKNMVFLFLFEFLFSFTHQFLPQNLPPFCSPMSGAAGQSGCTEDGRIHRVSGMATLQEPQVTTANDQWHIQTCMNYISHIWNVFFLPIDLKWPRMGF